MENRPLDQNELSSAPTVEEDEKDATSTDKLSTAQQKDVTPPFQKWINSFRVRHRGPSTIAERNVDGWENPPSDSYADNQTFESSSQNSSQLGTVKTISLSVASQSMAMSRSRSRGAASAFSSDMRGSGDSEASSRPTLSDYVDEAADTRAEKRRQVLRELVTTETDYVTGLKALSGVLSILDIRAQIQRNIARICVIHEEFLARLHEVTPDSASKIATDMPGTLSRLAAGDIPGLKNLSTRSVQNHNFKVSIKERLRVLRAEAVECFKVAREIEGLSTLFSEYAEFCTNYDLLAEDVAMVRRSVSDWAIYDKGIEALSKSVASIESRKNEENKAMSLNDLMIKMQPIQRLCKYSLLLQDLLRNTPISDCPTSHGGIREILESLRVLTSQINAATGNPVKKDFIQKTVRLQQKIDLSDSLPLRDIYKELGPMSLCGVLHVTYQAQNGADGEFMVCVLFSCYLLFARRSKDSNRLSVVACIYIADLRTDTQRNGRGLDCYDSLFTWKLLFQDHKESCELVLSASCAAEERLWKMETLKASAALTATPAKPGATQNPRRYSFNTLNLMQLDRVHYTVASVARRQSMDSVAITKRSHVQRVIIKKTHKPRKNVTIQDVTEEVNEATPKEPESEIERPKTPVSPKIMTVTGKRASRIYLEKMIADIYTKDVLPYPGMVLGRSDLFDRSTIMRRLSLHTGKQFSSISMSLSRSAPVDSRPSASYSGEEKTNIASQDGCNDQRDSVEESPKTPTSSLRRSMTLRIQETSRRSIGALSLSSPRGEKSHSQEIEPVATPVPSPTRKKWSKNLFSGFSKNLRRTEAGNEG
ncbi:hypothetical protein N7495_009234 [Penicillium taxi]|uniref:uncharacterized protein n=1 Tax=Penicillium taxi TaxID=168475 RepID=UPI002544F920|nr:uncharacterized protein N7495_009234 [Penicillium taxi]KAJ5884724.1 hypothetical protein N7495_009234 [Penicillium taxi]